MYNHTKYGNFDGENPFGKLSFRIRVLLGLDGQASEANESEDIWGKWEKRTLIEREEYEFKTSEP